MQKLLEDLRSGAISFTQFARLTDRDWRAMAAYLMRAWRSDSTMVTQDDVVQEMLVTAAQAVGVMQGVAILDTVTGRPITQAKPWDPKRGSSLRAYVVFQALDRAKKLLRSTWRHTHLESAFPAPNSDGVDWMLVRKGIFTAPLQDAVAAHNEALEDLSGWEREVAGMILQGLELSEIAAAITSRQWLREGAGAPSLRLASKATERVARKLLRC